MLAQSHFSLLGVCREKDYSTLLKVATIRVNSDTIMSKEKER
jgi:hypothetical protein